MPTRILRDWTDSDSMACVSAEAERLFARLIMKADDYGRFHAEPRRVKAALFPLSDTITAAECGRWIKEIGKLKLVTIYEAEGKQLLVINKFGQRMRNSVPKFPPPAGMCGDWRPDDSNSPQPADNPPQPAATCGELPQPAASCGESRPETESETRAESREPETKSETETVTHPRARAIQSSVMDKPEIASYMDDPAFRQFMADYPAHRRIAPRVAASLFAALSDPPAMLEVLAGLERMKASKGWTKENGELVHGMRKFIETEMWKGATSCRPARQPWGKRK